MPANTLITRELCCQALDNLDQSIAFLLLRISTERDACAIANLCETLDRLDTGKLLVTALSQRIATSSHI